MADGTTSGNNGALYFIVGALCIVVAIGAFLVLGGSILAYLLWFHLLKVCGATAASDRLRSGRGGKCAECARRCAARPAEPAARVLTSRQCISNRGAREARRVMRDGGSNLAEYQALV